jgi:hypothetical protein
VRSRHVHKWVKSEEPGYAEIGAMRRALGDDLVLMFLGFAEGDETSELEKSLAELEGTRDTLRARIDTLKDRTESQSSESPPAAPAAGAEAESASDVAAVQPGVSHAERARLLREISRSNGQLEQLERQIAARTRALPLFRAAAESDSLIDELRAQRDHPVHTLLRRLHHEQQSTELALSGEQF